MNFQGKINLLKLKNAGVVDVKGKESVKRCVVIPIEDNNIFISADENLVAKGAYIDFMAWENRQISQYGDTHGIRQSLPKDVREKMSEDELKAVPFIGNMKPFEIGNSASSVNAPSAVANGDDLPF